MDSTDGSLSKVVALLEREPAVAAVYLHGSTAKETRRSDSDLDLAILPAAGRSLSAMERLDLAQRLTAESGRRVDLGVLGTGNLVYAKEVIEHGRLLFTKDPGRSLVFPGLCLSLYADLQQSRKEVLDAYAA